MKEYCEDCIIELLVSLEVWNLSAVPELYV